MKEIRLGTIGSGMIVHSILNNVKVTDGIRLEAVYSRSREKGNAHGHAGIIIAHLGLKQRLIAKSADLLDFRQMLMMQLQTISSGIYQLIRSAALLVSCYHLFAATAITAYRIYAHRVVLWHNPRRNQGIKNADSARGIAAGICYPFCGSNSFFLIS